jgi:16S rRNA (cytidine1402-2'-O)-methyltransferase
MPGATAFVPALVNSGFDLSEFVFLGFPPHKKGRQTFIKQIASEKRTLVLYESPYRMVKFLEEFLEFVGDDRQISVSREISKKFEETVRGNASFLLSHFSIKAPKGEFVVCISST